MDSVTPPPLIVFGSHSDVGQRREHNEDSLSCVRLGAGVLLIVADGVGGAKAGEVASRMTADGMVEILSARFAKEEIPPDHRPWLDLAAREIDRRLRSAAQQPGLSGMGATLSALWLDGATGWWVQVGDSRIYRLRRGELRQISRDQSPVGSMRAEGQLTEEEARKHPYRHMIDQCLGGAGAQAEPDTGVLEIQTGDIFLLCSDGLSDGLWDRHIKEGLAKAADQTPTEVAQALVAGANAASGSDNITAVVSRVDRVPENAVEPARKPAGAFMKLIDRFGLPGGKRSAS